MTVKFGYFVLVSNLDLSPKDLLTEYFGRTDILGVTRQTIIVIENNKYDPTLELAMKISEYFEISVNEIFSLK
ncbi:MAG: helix-turn-helix domain-containing protein [Lachnospiraceae bacterium]|nr:helix-turn-helix domain-containing protein [Lachnospiraceae bacterium]